MFLCRGRYLIHHSFVCSSVAVVVVAVAIFVVGNAVDAVIATAFVIVAAAGIVVVVIVVIFRYIHLHWSILLCFFPAKLFSRPPIIITDIQFHFWLLFSDGDKRAVRCSSRKIQWDSKAWPPK